MAKRRSAPAEQGPSSIERALKDHPEKITISFGGKDRDFLLNAYGAKILREKGHDPIPVIFTVLKSLAPMAAGLSSDGKSLDVGMALSLLEGTIIDDLCVVLWWGFIAYDRELTLEEIEIWATPKSTVDIITQLYAQMSSFGGDEDPSEATEPVPDDGDSGP